MIEVLAIGLPVAVGIAAVAVGRYVRHANSMPSATLAGPARPAQPSPIGPGTQGDSFSAEELAADIARADSVAGKSFDKSYRLWGTAGSFASDPIVVWLTPYGRKAGSAHELPEDLLRDWDAARAEDAARSRNPAATAATGDRGAGFARGY